MIDDFTLMRYTTKEFMTLELLQAMTPDDWKRWCELLAFERQRIREEIRQYYAHLPGSCRGCAADEKGL